MEDGEEWRRERDEDEVVKQRMPLKPSKGMISG